MRVTSSSTARRHHSGNGYLAGAANQINNLNSGSDPSEVTASVINFGANDYRLILTSDTTGAKGISLLNGSANSGADVRLERQPDGHIKNPSP